MLANELFFDQISDYYDDMINFEKALRNRQKALSRFITPDMKAAVDLGCGTGLDSISLSLIKLQVTSFDISDGMISIAKGKAKLLKLNIDFYKYSLTDIPAEFHDKFDFAVSLGNTLANLNTTQLQLAIKKAYKLLKKDGSLLIQILNYGPLLLKSERIVNITESEGKYFIRFYDFYEDYLNFNILTYLKDNLKNYQLSTTKLYPHSIELLKNILQESGFLNIESFSGFDKSLFQEEFSKDLFLFATK